jgi:glycosyltransferase involved in cell wall biosynthesis
MIKMNTEKTIAFISSYPPTKCGIATFTSHLVKNIRDASGWTFEPQVVTMQSDSTRQFTEPVKFVIGKDVKSDYMEAADCINAGGVDVVSLQHEFGLFGGPGGSHIVGTLERLQAPVVTTLHTVLEKPTPEYFTSLVDVCDCSERIVVMNERGFDMLERVYGVPLSKVELIPHGIPDVPFGQEELYKRKLGMSGRKVIMTFGLIGPNKGIEVMIRAMPRILQEHPTALYLVVGMTHPGIVKEDGYRYEDQLHSLVSELGLAENVAFDSRFVTDKQLRDYLAAADVYVTPYLHKEQLTSGTLAFAVGSGTAVVSTPYWAAEELLANDRGLLLPFGDWHELGSGIAALLVDGLHLAAMQQRAYNYGREMVWPKVGRSYWDLLQASIPSRGKPATERPTKELLTPFSLPRRGGSTQLAWNNESLTKYPAAGEAEPLEPVVER